MCIPGFGQSGSNCPQGAFLREKIRAGDIITSCLVKNVAFRGLQMAHRLTHDEIWQWMDLSARKRVGWRNGGCGEVAIRCGRPAEVFVEE